MKRALVAAVLVLALPAVAQAKELTGLAVCGPDGCKRTKLGGFGHEAPFADQREQPPPPGSFYRIDFEIDGRLGAWFAYYEPRSGLAAYEEGMAAGMTWTRLDPAVAKAVKETARSIEAFPRPTVPKVRIGSRSVTDDPETWLRLFSMKGPSVSPRGGAEVIRFTSSAASPWTVSSLLYYPANDVLQTGLGKFVKLPPDLAADVEAARPLGAGDGEGFPWPILAAALAGGLLLVGGAFLFYRTRMSRAVVTALFVALVAAGPAEAKYAIRLTLSDSTPVVGQPVRVVLRADSADPGGTLRLVAVPPRITMYAAIRAETFFNVRLRQDGAAWRGTVRFNRPGRWLLVVPNWGAPGYAMPPPVAKSVLVSRP